MAFSDYFTPQSAVRTRGDIWNLSRLEVLRLRVETLEGLKLLHWVLISNFINEIIEIFRMHCL